MLIYTLCLNVFFGVLLIWFLWWIFLDTGHTKKDEFQCELISDCLICPFFWRFSDKHDTHKFEGQNVEFLNVFSMFHQSKTSDHIQSTCCLFSVDEISLCDLWGRLFWWISLGTGRTGMTYLNPDDSWTHAIFTKMCFRTIIRYIMQSHYREVSRWEIFMEQELRFGLDLGRFGNFWSRFFHVFIDKTKILKTC